MIHSPDHRLAYVFQYNPGMITTERGVAYQEVSAPGVFDGEQIYGRGTGTTIKFTLFIDGREVPFSEGIQSVLYGIASFMHPDPALPHNTTQFVSPPVCIFRLGNVVHETVMVSHSEKVFMFNRAGYPVRAEVDITLRRVFPSRYVEAERERMLQMSWTPSGIAGLLSMMDPASESFPKIDAIVRPTG